MESIFTILLLLLLCVLFCFLHLSTKFRIHLGQCVHFRWTFALIKARSMTLEIKERLLTAFIKSISASIRKKEIIYQQSVRESTFCVNDPHILRKIFSDKATCDRIDTALKHLV